MAFSPILTANEDTRAGRMLAAGRIRLTVVSPRTGAHITIALRAKLDNNDRTLGPKRWLSVPLAKASHLFIEVPTGDGWSDRIGVMYPNAELPRIYRDTDPARAFAFREALRFLNGQTTRCSVLEESRCGVCGRSLTDPVSIERGIGPECFGELTKAHHQHRWTAPDPPQQTLDV